MRFLILFVTSQCNCRCQACFYWRRLNAEGDLSAEEFKKISTAIGPLHTLLLSGGEPFLRIDLEDICRTFIKQNGISVLAVPTNGTCAERVIKFSESILKAYPGVTLSIAVSLDGCRETHDRMRGVEGVFRKASETLRELSKMRGRFRNLEAGVNTVIAKDNIAELESFMDTLYNDFDIDFHEFELARGDRRDSAIKLPSLRDVERIHRYIVMNRERYLDRARASLPEKAAVISLLAFVHKLKERVLGGRKPIYNCTAGRNISVIDANGDVRLCELLPPVKNIRAVGYNLHAALDSEDARRQKREIADKRCGCTHVCFIKQTIASHPGTLCHLFSNYISHKAEKWLPKR